MSKFVKEAKLDASLGDGVAAYGSSLFATTAGAPASTVGPAELASIRKVRVKVGFSRNFTADADLAFGQKIYTHPAGAFIPLATKYELELYSADGLGMAVAANDGEMALGSVIASGAVDELGGTSTFEDYVAAPIALTALTKSGVDINTENHFSKGTDVVFDGSATAYDVFLNFAGTWDYTATTGILFKCSGYVTMWYIWLGDD